MGAREFAVLLAATLCVTVAVGGAAVGGAAESGTATRPAAQSQPPGVTPDTVLMDVTVHENGTASWEIVYRTRLDDPETTEAFRSYRADVKNDSEAYSQQFVDRMTATVDSAERSTGREMDARQFGVEASVREFPQRYGVVVYSFQWVGFAGTDGDALRVGDALSGLFLDEKTRLLVSWPEGYEPETIRPEPDERRTRTAVWAGPTDFAADQPRLVIAPPAAGPLDLPISPLAVGLVVAVLGAGVAGGWWFLYRDGGGIYRNGSAGDPDESRDEPPEDLLSNEERVLRLLERRGGRIKQKAVVDELGWTEAKTSQVVGSLREQGEIESFRLGRENVLALARERQEP
ncbi:helix-turn-helix transcriptional regulator [Halorussus litoreus]|uniref:helix-turn-helix transcriptional regulator n=1 Tax=Halorussus litoreus TaxID=1710536 RepID=UPI000E2418B9|nr:hypothetical protein [Halorussus litoreus]